MPVCRNCGEAFPFRVVIDGRRRVLANRRYCLACSPFHQHNTRRLELTKSQGAWCVCRACKRPYQYSARAGHTFELCATCQTGDRRRNRKERVVRLLGGACQLCGYDRCLWALDLHHVDASSKDFNVSSSNTRRWASIVDEVRKCVLLCRNCHQEVHSGMTDPPPLRVLPPSAMCEP
jgi:hypothetical protein